MSTVESEMSMSVESGAFGALVAKYGWLKLLTLSSAAIGAAIMMAFRPPASRREVFIHAAVALGMSLLFGDTVTQYADYMLDFIDLKVAPFMDYLQFTVSVHGLVGACSWGAVGAIASYMDRLKAGQANAADTTKTLNK